MDPGTAPDDPAPEPRRRRRAAGRRHVGVAGPVVGTALAAVVAWAAHTALGPSTLWIDDAWVALAARADSPEQLGRTIVTAPGFTVLLAGWLRAVGLEALGGVAAQAPALAFGLLAPGALFAGLRRWAGWDAVPALVAAVLVATSPLVVVFSTRVKHYTLDVLLAALLTAYALGLARRARDGDLDARGLVRRQWGLAAAGALAVAMTAATASVAGAAVAVAWASAALVRARTGSRPGGGDPRDPTGDARPGWRDAVATAAPAAAFGAFALAWQALVLARTIPTGMYTFWRDAFLPVDEGVGAVATATWAGLGDAAAATLALPAGLALLLALVGLVRAARRDPAVPAVVLLPLLASIALALLQRAPWGGGRTDSHLVVALAIAIGAAFARPGPRAWALRPAVPFAAVVVGALAWSSVEHPTYPAEDLRPLVAVVEEGHRPDEVVLVYPFARLAWALYSPAPVRFRPNDGSSIGYAIDLDDPRVVLLPAWRRDPSRYGPIVAAAVEGWCGAWLPASHVGDDLREVKQALASAGLRQVGTGWEAPGATLSHWRRPGC